MLPTDMALVEDKSFRKWVEIYAEDKDRFFEDFAQVCSSRSFAEPFGPHLILLFLSFFVQAFGKLLGSSFHYFPAQSLEINPFVSTSEICRARS